MFASRAHVLNVHPSPHAPRLAGTGTVAFGMVDGGRVQARASGWGPAFMDGGSGWVGVVKVGVGSRPAT